MLSLKYHLTNSQAASMFKLKSLKEQNDAAAAAAAASGTTGKKVLR